MLKLIWKNIFATERENTQSSPLYFIIIRQLREIGKYIRWHMLYNDGPNQMHPLFGMVSCSIDETR